jgi:hypothetical protein
MKWHGIIIEAELHRTEQHMADKKRKIVYKIKL